MGRSTRTPRVDAIDGSAAAHTVAFALDGQQYEIDLNEANAAALREVFGPYVAAGRKAGSSRGSATPKGRATGQPTSSVAGAKPPSSAASPGKPLATVVPLPRRPRAPVGESPIVGQRGRLSADVGELTRVFAVALLAVTADRLVSLIMKPGRAADASSDPSDTSSVAPAG